MTKQRAVLLGTAAGIAAAAAACFLMTIRTHRETPERRISRCFLRLNAACRPADRIEILLDGESLGEFQPPRAGQRLERVVFEAAGEGRFTFKIFQGDRLNYMPEFDVSIRPGDMLDISFEPDDKPPSPMFGPGPRRSFPALAEEIPARVWCWFGPANVRTDYLYATLRSPGDVSAFKARLAGGRYRILGEETLDSGKDPRFRLAPPRGMTLVEAVLEIEKWSGVRTVYLDPAHVY